MTRLRALRGFLSGPRGRLVARAVYAGVAAGLLFEQHHASAGAWRGAAAAGALAAFETLTPANRLVGLFKSGV